MVVAAVEDDLGRHVLGRAAERPRLAARADSLRKTKVHLQPPIQVTVPVHMNYRKHGRMQIKLHRRNNLPRPNSLLRKKNIMHQPDPSSHGTA